MSCFKAIKESWDALEAQGKEHNGLLKLSRTFRLCQYDELSICFLHTEFSSPFVKILESLRSQESEQHRCPLGLVRLCIQLSGYGRLPISFGFFDAFACLPDKGGLFSYLFHYLNILYIYLVNN